MEQQLLTLFPKHWNVYVFDGKSRQISSVIGENFKRFIPTKSKNTKRAKPLLLIFYFNKKKTRRPKKRKQVKRKFRANENSASVVPRLSSPVRLTIPNDSIIDVDAQQIRSGGYSPVPVDTNSTSTQFKIVSPSLSPLYFVLNDANAESTITVPLSPEFHHPIDDDTSQQTGNCQDEFSSLSTQHVSIANDSNGFELLASVISPDQMHFDDKIVPTTVSNDHMTSDFERMSIDVDTTRSTGKQLPRTTVEVDLVNQKISPMNNFESEAKTIVNVVDAKELIENLCREKDDLVDKFNKEIDELKEQAKEEIDELRKQAMKEIQKIEIKVIRKVNKIVFKRDTFVKDIDAQVNELTRVWKLEGRMIHEKKLKRMSTNVMKKRFKK